MAHIEGPMSQRLAAIFQLGKKENKGGFVPEVGTLKETVEEVASKVSLATKKKSPAKFDQDLRDRILDLAGLPEKSIQEFRVEETSQKTVALVYGQNKPYKRAFSLHLDDSSLGFAVYRLRREEKSLFKVRRYEKITDPKHLIKIVDDFIRLEPNPRNPDQFEQVVDISKEANQKKMEEYSTAAAKEASEISVTPKGKTKIRYKKGA